MTDQPFPDLLVSEARTRHYVDGEMITARRGINWPAGTTVTDDSINEKVDLSGLGGAPTATLVGYIEANTFTSTDTLDWDFTDFVSVVDEGDGYDFNGESYQLSNPTLRILNAGLYSISASVYFDEAGQIDGLRGTWRYLDFYEFGFDPPNIDYGLVGAYTVIAVPPFPAALGNTIVPLCRVSHYVDNDEITFTSGHNATGDKDARLTIWVERLG